MVLTQDSEDFQDLHELIGTAGGSHHGILVVRKANDPARDMRPRHIVGALRKLEQSGLGLTNQLIVLNHWR